MLYVLEFQPSDRSAAAAVSAGGWALGRLRLGYFELIKFHSRNTFFSVRVMVLEISKYQLRRLRVMPARIRSKCVRCFESASVRAKTRPSYPPRGFQGERRTRKTLTQSRHITITRSRIKFQIGISSTQACEETSEDQRDALFVRFFFVFQVPSCPERVYSCFCCCICVDAAEIVEALAWVPSYVSPQYETLSGRGTLLRLAFVACVKRRGARPPTAKQHSKNLRSDKVQLVSSQLERPVALGQNSGGGCRLRCTTQPELAYPG